MILSYSWFYPICTLLMTDVFGNFRKVYKLGPAKFLSAPGLAWQAALKKTEVELELLTDFDVMNGWKRD